MKNFINIMLASICVTLIFFAGKKNDQETIVKTPTQVEKKITSDIANNYTDALSIAQNTNSKMLLIFSAKWCVPCQKFDYEVLQSLRVRNKIKQSNFIETHIDIDEEKNKDVKSRFNIKTIPYFAIVDQNERILKKDEGYKNIRDFMAWLD